MIKQRHLSIEQIDIIREDYLKYKESGQSNTTRFTFGNVDDKKGDFKALAEMNKINKEGGQNQPGYQVMSFSYSAKASYNNGSNTSQTQRSRTYLECVVRMSGTSNYINFLNNHKFDAIKIDTYVSDSTKNSELKISQSHIFAKVISVEFNILATSDHYLVHMFYEVDNTTIKELGETSKGAQSGTLAGQFQSSETKAAKK